MEKRKRHILLVVLLAAALGLSGWGYYRVHRLEAELAILESQYGQLQAGYAELEDRYGKVWTEDTAEDRQPLTAPYAAISEGNITWAWRDMGGGLQRWVMPVDNYRSWVTTPKPHKTVALQCGEGVCTMLDYRPYVHPDEFSEVVPSLYEHSGGGQAFIQEVYNLASQLTVYSTDVGEVPRWPIETLAEGRGDCEDLTILLASLIKAAPHPYTLSLVYIDTANPTDPQYPDHVIIVVEDEDWRLFVECSSDEGWKFYDYIQGWFFEL